MRRTYFKRDHAQAQAYTKNGTPSFLWAALAGVDADSCKVIYTGAQAMQTQFGELLPWSRLEL